MPDKGQIASVALWCFASGKC